MGEDEVRDEAETATERKESFEMGETSKKIIRVITVTTYLFSVSMAAIMLSLYYLFFWNPTVQSGAQKLVDPIQFHFSRLYFNVTQPGRRWRPIEARDSSKGHIIRCFGNLVAIGSERMSKISVGRGSPNGAVGSEIKLAGNDKEKMYEPKHRRKLVRVLTVIAYLFSVSLVAIMLSLFYVFIYNPGKPAKDPGYTHSPTHPLPNQEFMDTMNDTYPNLDREEPRALPVMGDRDAFWNQSQVLNGGQTHYNHSDGLQVENKTIYL